MKGAKAYLYIFHLLEIRIQEGILLVKVSFLAGRRAIPEDTQVLRHFSFLQLLFF